MSTQIQKTESHESLLGGFYGYVNAVHETESGELVEIHIADASEDWECAEWYLDQKLIARCDGYNGVEWEGDFKPTEELDEIVTSYELSGLNDDAKAALQIEAEEGDEDVKIEVTSEYYESHDSAWKNRPLILTESESDEIKVFETFEDAQDWINSEESETYHLSHGEAGRPSYRIVK